MSRPPSVQITRDPRKDGSITFGLRVRVAGTDERVALGNTHDGWDEMRVETARKQLLAKIELGRWTPAAGSRHPTLRSARVRGRSRPRSPLLSGIRDGR